MSLTTQVNFNGNCKEALQFYSATLGVHECTNTDGHPLELSVPCVSHSIRLATADRLSHRACRNTAACRRVRVAG